jgi:hypothetical protein
MPKILQFRRYPNSDVISITGYPGEIIVDNTYNILTVHDGTTVGGNRLSSEGLLYSTVSSNVTILNARIDDVNTFTQAAFSAANTALQPAGNTYYVSTTGNDLNSGKIPGLSKATVKAAVAAANPGDSVYIYSGTYTENTPIIIPQQVQVSGAGERNTIIQPVNSANDIFWINNAGYVTGMKFQNYSANAVCFPAPIVESSNAASATLNTITLSTTAQPYDNYYNSMQITITSGTGSGQIANVISYVGNSNLATIDKNWTTIPDTTSIYNLSIPLRYTPASASTRYSTYITNSPYIYNSSSITPLGGTGLCIDGYRATGNKSMISSQFTQVNTGGVGVKIINDAYAQLVSIYGIFCDKAFWADSGGTASMGNCDVNFGNIGLYANGYGNIVMTAQLDGTQAANNYTLNLTNIVANTSLSVSANVPYSGLIAYINGDSPGYFYNVDSSTPISSGKTTTTFLTANSNIFTSGTTVTFYQQSQLRASGQTFEFVGAGTTINAIPRLGGVANSANNIVYSNNAIVFATSTDEGGNFKVGDLVLNQSSSTISGRTFNKSLFAVMTPYILALE